MLDKWDGKWLLLKSVGHDGVKKSAQFYFRKKQLKNENNRLKNKFLTQSSYSFNNANWSPESIFSVQKKTDLKVHQKALMALGDKYLSHYFNLLGSGWVCLNLTSQSFVNSSNIELSNKFKSKISSGYKSIAWNRDFISDYEWDHRQFFSDIIIGQKRGVDIKRPWELGRFYHFSDLIHLFNLTQEEKYFLEIKNQFYDFISANPPFFGVQWGNAMEASLRAINWIYMVDQIDPHKKETEATFLQDMANALDQHLEYIISQLEWTTIARSNHYLANLLGLIGILGRISGRQDQQDLLYWASREFSHEVRYQFLSDGGNFEGSTGYHRLSCEIMFLTYLCLENRRQEIQPQNYQSFKNNNIYKLPFFHKGKSFISADRTLILKAHHFLKSTSANSGQMIQVGDMDSGRVLKLTPLWNDQLAQENHLCVDVVTSLLGPKSEFYLESGIFKNNFLPPQQKRNNCIRNLSFSAFLKNDPFEFRDQKRYSWTSASDLHANLSFETFEQFGLFIVKSDHLFLSIRCGGLRTQNGVGGHSHNDQLSIYFELEGKKLIVDPGSFAYTSDLKQRNSYRSVLAHFCPTIDKQEPSRLDLGPFRLRQNYKAECLYFDGKNFLGYHTAYLEKVFRCIVISKHSVEIIDSATGNKKIDQLSIRRNKFDMPVLFSVGYGELSKNEV